MATHSSIHAWKISWMEPGGYSPWGHKESVMGYHGSCYGSFLGKHVAQRNMFFQFHIFGRLLDYLQQILMSFSCANLFLKLCLTLQPHGPARLLFHGIFQARTLNWVAFPSPGDLPDTGIEPEFPALAGRSLTTKPLSHQEAPHSASVQLSSAQFIRSVVSNSL